MTGTVTLDGQPLADAVVSFQSKDAGRVASGATDAAGNYTIYLLNDIEGAPVGTNQVMIVTAKPGDDAIPGSAKPEVLPAKYNAESELSADVQPGDNQFDFELTSA
ncbi:carboxypeptidase-like regulatory domain-containing protein [Rosistilla carotiformis]|uniref:carboxypeptidase-like regulatory domain-containing protein n=1 Tax=Rosistilla carotiformis TaxID=2528017 RepID=UPI001E36EE90|nr:carboxypeptidase-like regulatory domain-containing protein [Rosistilla carotiformis]